ncbi:hypothetical protein BDQ17DRAFT_1334790 [Cyathus striatus]|nr:hypothetical protein BDQ17DRAFT_1334790 [Cyathus striatus]
MLTPCLLLGWGLWHLCKLLWNLLLSILGCSLGHNVVPQSLPFNKAGKENIDLTAKDVRLKLNSSHLISIVHAVMEKEPFLAPYGKKNAAWLELNKYLVEHGFPKTSSDLLRRKAGGLVGYYKNPKSLDSKVKSIAAIISGSSDNVTIAAILDHISKQWDDSLQLSEDKKAEMRKKHDDDCLGGEALWQASLNATACEEYMEWSNKDQDKLVNILEGLLEIQKQQVTRNN